MPTDFSTLDTIRRRRCKSCGQLIDIESVVLKFHRWRPAKYDSIEERILGEGAEIPLAPYYFCEWCGEIALNLKELEYCIDPEMNMKETLEEYHQLTGWRQNEK
jgi:hypothetical protein